MGYLKLYALLSLIIGFVSSLVLLFKKKSLIHDEQDDEQVRKEYLDTQVEKGHLQKVEYGDRTAYHEDTLWGETAVRTTGKINALKKTYRVPYVLFLVVVSTTYLAVVWPKELYYLVMDMFSPGDENGGTDGK